jgi:26S proteasome regulatory subunit N10
MPLEATMMIIDNSEFMRNGDYQPTRFSAQSDAVNTVFQTKIDANPENTVGIMTMAGKGPEVLVTHTKEIGQILSALHATASKVSGSIDIPTALSIAQLALKHRENKNLRQRIIVFVASPLEGPAADEKSMVKLAKKLKKNNVAVDVVAYGDGIEEGERNVLKAFVDSASSGDNSHLVSIPPGPHLLSDILISSPILAGDRGMGIPEEAMGDVGVGGSGAGGTGGTGSGFEFGVDPTLDPELAMALRMSMQEEQARQAAEEQARAAASSESAPPAASTSISAPSEPAPPTDSDEEALLAQALAMSEAKDVEMEGDEEEEDEEMDEEEAIARAIEMSMKGEEEEENKRN